MGIGASIATLALLTAAAPPPVKLALNGGWTADYATNSCRVIGEFGAGPRSATLAFEQVAPGDLLSMLVVSNQLEKTLYGTRGFTAFFMPYAKAGSRDGQSATANDKAKTPAAFWQRISFANMPSVEEEKARRIEMQEAMRSSLRKAGKAEGPPETPPPPTPEEVDKKLAESNANLAAITAVRVVEPGHKSIELATGPLAPVVATIDACANRQLKSWGIDPELEKKISKRAELKDWWNLLNASDYPVSSIRKGEESQLRVRLLVDSGGRITDCVPITPINPATFGQVVCSKFLKARAEPARLEDGRKVPSYIVQSIRFMLP